MDYAQNYRNRAAQARRLASGVTDRELEAQLLGLAREYDATANRMEQLSAPPFPPKDDSSTSG